jgi:hypothetical protein
MINRNDVSGRSADRFSTAREPEGFGSPRAVRVRPSFIRMERGRTTGAAARGVRCPEAYELQPDRRR